MIYVLFSFNTNICQYVTELGEKAQVNQDSAAVFNLFESNEYLTIHQKEFLAKETLAEDEIPSEFDISDGECHGLIETFLTLRHRHNSAIVRTVTKGKNQWC